MLASAGLPIMISTSGRDVSYIPAGSDEERPIKALLLGSHNGRIYGPQVSGAVQTALYAILNDDECGIEPDEITLEEDVIQDGDVTYAIVAMRDKTESSLVIDCELFDESRRGEDYADH